MQDLDLSAPPPREDDDDDGNDGGNAGVAGKAVPQGAAKASGGPLGKAAAPPGSARGVVAGGGKLAGAAATMAVGGGEQPGGGGVPGAQGMRKSLFDELDEEGVQEDPEKEVLAFEIQADQVSVDPDLTLNVNDIFKPGSSYGWLFLSWSLPWTPETHIGL